MSTIERERIEVQVDEREQRARTLEAAALEIEVRGWTQGSLCDDHGRVCLMGAVAWALDAAWDWERVLQTWAPDWIGIWPTYRGCELFPLAEWNDRETTSAADVTFVLRWRAEEIRDGR